MVDTVRVVGRVLRAEGWRAAARRALDRLDERGGRVAGANATASLASAPVLNVLGTPPAHRLGGLPTQLLARLGEESTRRAVVLFHPDGSGYRGVEIRPRTALTLGFTAGRGLAAAVADTAARIGAAAVHLEGVGAHPPEELAQLAEIGLPLLVSIHDFAGWCPTAHLLESTTERFCSFSSDAARCARCLAAAGLGDDLGVRRAATARLLGAARVTIFPSVYLRDRHRELFPGPRCGLERVIEPASAARTPRPAAATRARRVTPSVAFVGSVSPLKGGRLIEPVARALRERDGSRTVHVLGGGEASILLALRRVAGVTVHGYYRAGSLPAHLVRLGATVAVAPSIVPEAYHLTLSECWLAGVPCVAFDHGATAERIGAHGGGRLVPLEDGARGLVEAIEALLADPERGDVTRARASVTTPAAAASAHLALYAELGLTPADTTLSKRAPP